MRKERILELLGKVVDTLKEEGVSGLVGKTANFIKYRVVINKSKAKHEFKDVLFINGCSLPHPQRYRVDHQIEQLESVGITCSKVDYDKVTLDLVKYFRAFVIYRCPIIPDIEEFIRLAKENNKVTFYDIDDLVFDLEYTKDIKYLDTISEAERNLYNNGVERMGATLKLCDYGIASTTRLQTEMSKFLKEVVVNRNVASEAMTEYSEKALKLDNKDKDKIIIGYFSGTLTHNDDFKLVMPTIVELMRKNPKVYLKIVGILDLPEEMKGLEDRVIVEPFVKWQKLPMLIHSVDINIAPIEDTIFNEAKSENKWTEAALVKVPTVASNVGAFKDVIEDGVTGFLCSTEEEWKEKLEELISDKELREKIGNNAYRRVHDYHLTTSTGFNLKEFILSKLNKNIAFVVPSTNISGGVLVTIKHAQLLKKNGYDVTLINAEKEDTTIVNKDGSVYVIPACETFFDGHFDMLVATMWLTLDFVKSYTKCEDKRYLVQGYEVDFYKYGEYERIRSNATYSDDTIKYLTVSKWCLSWLKEKYQRQVRYAPNGIELTSFNYKKRKLDGKVKILIEGNNKDYFKNVDEAFKIVNELDPEKFEINYLSYEKEPKDWYRVDNFYHKVSHDEIGRVYEKADILIKTSILESFSYPPLEMMATGGYCVVLPNDGNVEYLVDEENCLFYEKGNIQDAVNKINRVCEDKKLQEKLSKNGLKTAQERDWKNLEEAILKLYQ